MIWPNVPLPVYRASRALAGAVSRALDKMRVNNYDDERWHAAFLDVFDAVVYINNFELLTLAEILVEKRRVKYCIKGSIHSSMSRLCIEAELIDTELAHVAVKLIVEDKTGKRWVETYSPPHPITMRRRHMDRLRLWLKAAALAAQINLRLRDP